MNPYYKPLLIQLEVVLLTGFAFTDGRWPDSFAINEAEYIKLKLLYQKLSQINSDTYYSHLKKTYAGRIIQRNYDRECSRKDEPIFYRY